MQNISVRGAREHNLKNIDVEIPRDSLSVITGLSGSGKSSLAFDTIYAEGQRRYVESLSAYARQFLELMQKPDVDAIEGLSPAISIEQKTTSKNPRSTVGTVTEIYDYMRLLFARTGIPYSPTTGLPIEAQTISQMVDRVGAMNEGTRLFLLAPIARGKKGEFKKEIQDLARRGFQRLRIDGEMFDIEETPALDKKYKHDIEVVVDRIVVREGIKTRLAESFETALALSDGLAYVDAADTPPPVKSTKKGGIKDYVPEGRTVFSAKFACPVSGFSIDEIEPRLFSFNNPFGACPACDGLGTEMFFDADLVVPDETLSLNHGALSPWANSSSKYYGQTLEGLANHYDFLLTTPWHELPKKIREIVLFGSGREEVKMSYHDGNRRYEITKPFEGVIPNMERRYRETESNVVREELAKYLSTQPCPDCGGTRLNVHARNVFVGDSRICDVTGMGVGEAKCHLESLSLTGARGQVAEKILKEISARLSFLMDVGLDYLTLDRAAETLSGGEAQRIRLASQIGAGLVGVMYILDEPSIGLHQRDNRRLLDSLLRLRDIGNTVIVVEHDEEAIREADHVLDIGPGAGVHGGQVVASGTPEAIANEPASLTGQYLSRFRRISVPEERRAYDAERTLRLTKARGNNLAGVDLEVPLGLMTCVTGVSGSGKSTLINDTLYRAVAQRLNDASTEPAPFDELLGLEAIDKVVDIDQSPIGRTPRSNPATYSGLFTTIRELFAGTPEARSRGYTPGRFSFNVRGGRCEACKGDGLVKVEMHFLPDVYVACDVCKGKRYNRETLDIRYRGKTIDEVLGMTIEEARQFFEAIPMLARRLDTLLDVGLGYVCLGQSATTLSGGEAQRVKLSRELSKRDTGRTLYILDEPTTGLHFFDVEQLLRVLHRLRDRGNTVVVIEHNLDVIKTADWIIDLGEEGGDGGGEIIATGPPEAVSEVARSHTGRYLAKVLAPRVDAAD